eukprot:m.13381 g.13381  ORF g.13381 m.13381 type:complete len:455 (+) comp24755_c0_seq3:79-1443(+)
MRLQLFCSFFAALLLTCSSMDSNVITNIALKKPTKQSSTYGGYAVSSRAVDGDTNGNFFGKSVSCTNLNSRAFWEVTFPRQCSVHKIVIFNRADCCGSRLLNFDVILKNSLSQTVKTFYYGYGQRPKYEFVPSSPINNIRQVRVQLRGKNYLQLAEVQVFGHCNDINVCPPVNNDCPVRLPSSNIQCSSQLEGAIRYNKGLVEVCNGKQWTGLSGKLPLPQPPKPPSPIGSEGNPAKSCNQIFNSGRRQAGVYFLKQGFAPSSYKAYCRDGWTLLMKIDGKRRTFAYDSSYWTSNALFNPTAVNVDRTEAKFPAALYMPFTQLHLVMNSGSRRTLTIAKVAPSFVSIFKSGKYQPIALNRHQWKTIIDWASLQKNCNKGGFNVQSPKHVRVRIGISSNQEGDCNSNDSWLGFGGAGNSCRHDFNARPNSCGNVATCHPDNGDKNTFAFGLIWAR